MRTMIASSLIALSLVGATPVLAQGVYVGPGGVGVDVAPHRYYGGYDRERYRPYYRNDEGRSAYRDREYRRDRDYDR